MRTPFVFVAGLLALLLAAGPASAQGFGLDLSDDTSSTPEEASDAAESDISDTEMPDTGSLGLDLSGGMPSASDVDLQPRFVLLGLEAPRRTPAKAMKRWQGWLEGVARRTGRVAVNRTVTDAEQTLGEDYAAALRCAEASCFAEPADMLEADLVTTASLSRQGRTWTLRMWTYDRDRGVVEEDVVTGRSPRDSRFIQNAGSALGRRLSDLARPRALLKVSVNAPQAVVRVGERMLGLGNVEARLPPGEVVLTVEATDYETVTRTVTLASGETQQVDVMLEFSGPAPEGPPDEDAAVAKRSRGSSGTPLYTRPALYTALVGLVAVGVGAMVGAQASLAGADAQVDANGDSVLDMTRRDYLAVRQEGHIATALIAGGGALAAGSAAWLFLVPTNTAPEGSRLAASRSSGPNPSASMGLHLVVGGSF